MKLKNIIFLSISLIICSINIKTTACEYLDKASSNQWRTSKGGYWFKVVPSYNYEPRVKFEKCTLTSTDEQYDSGGYNVLTGWFIQPHTDRWEYYTCGKHKLQFSKGYASNIWSIADTSGSYHNINFPYKADQENYSCSNEKYKDVYKTAKFKGSKLILVERTNYRKIKFNF